MERGQWGKVREPSLLLANHPPLWEMVRVLRDVSRFSSDGKGVKVVMDAAFLRAAEDLFKLDGIPVDVAWSRKRYGGLDSYLISMMVRKWGEVSGAYDEALGGSEVNKQIREVLESGRSVFLCPAAGGNVSGRWRSGVGQLIKGIYEDRLEEELGVGLISAAGGEYVLLSFSSLASLLDRDLVEGMPSSRRVALEMQKVFEEKLVVVV